MLDVTNGDVDLTKRKRSEVVLSVLSHLSNPTPSTGTIQSAIALASFELQDGLPFTFTETKYGPRIPTFDQLIETLESEGYVKQVTTTSNGKHVTCLTRTSKPLPKFEFLSEHENNQLKWVANTHVNESGSGKLLSFLHKKYPEYFQDT